MRLNGESAPPTVFLNEPTPKLALAVVNRNVHWFAFSFDGCKMSYLRLSLYSTCIRWNFHYISSVPEANEIVTSNLGLSVSQLLFSFSLSDKILHWLLKWFQRFHFQRKSICIASRICPSRGVLPVCYTTQNNQITLIRLIIPMIHALSVFFLKLMKYPPDHPPKTPPYLPWPKQPTPNGALCSVIW